MHQPNATPEVTPELVASHGLTPEEYEKILNILGRAPNLTELGIFSVMWSEHCSYKTTRKWLRTLPTQAPHVICGPGENAGVIDIGCGLAAIFKMESHNHPSYIEPYQGAATGVGGILRDVFTMGARPIANLNSLRFGAPEHPKTKRLVAGVVAGIGGYGNCVGVPTVGGECTFHASYNGNILVNAMTVGLASADKIFYSKAAGLGNPVVYVGSRTGRDGIHGATMASAEFGEDAEEKRPTVQVGDPFTEKLLIEACLELMATDAIVAIQDMGAAGLTSSSLEMAGKGGLGFTLALDQVPMREEGMTPYEIMLSESQERMLMVLKPEKEQTARRIFEKWGLAFAIIGHITDTQRLVLTMHEETVADLPIAPISTDAPILDRPYIKTPPSSATEEMLFSEINAKAEAIGLQKALETLIHCPDIASKRWIWEQYDHQVMNDTLASSGGDAAIVRVHGTSRALALTTDCTPRYCFADPYEGGKQAVAESWRNLIAVGATPLAITNCLNFGNPQKPEIMGQIVGCLEGMRDACLALNYPVVSGNVSLYNETSTGEVASAVQPTPAIGGVGILADLRRSVGLSIEEEGLVLLLLGTTKGHIGCSLYLREVFGEEKGAPPPVDLLGEHDHGQFVRGLIEAGKIAACHDLSDGGLLVALAEMCMRKGIGVEITLPEGLPAWRFAFGEDQGRYLLAVTENETALILKQAQQANLAIYKLGKTISDRLIVENHCDVAIAELSRWNESWMPSFME